MAWANSFARVRSDEYTGKLALAHATRLVTRPSRKTAPSAPPSPCEGATGVHTVLSVSTHADIGPGSVVGRAGRLGARAAVRLNAHGNPYVPVIRESS